MQREDDPIAIDTARHMEHFAVDGLRTLCIAERELEQEYYEEWNKRYHQAITSLSHKERELDKVAEEIEKVCEVLLVPCAWG